MANPFKYIPRIARKLKGLDPHSKEYSANIALALSDGIFVQKLYESLAKSPYYEEESNRMYNVLSTFDMFIKTVLITGIITLALWLIFLGKGEPYALYGLVAMIGAVLFTVFYGLKWRKALVLTAKAFLERYELPKKEFSDEQLDKLVAIESSTVDLIAPEEMDKKISCGCYTCEQIYTSDKLVAKEGDFEYHCPFCDKTTVISERCGHEITPELIGEMHDYWAE